MKLINEFLVNKSKKDVVSDKHIHKTLAKITYEVIKNRFDDLRNYPEETKCEYAKEIYNDKLNAELGKKIIEEIKDTVDSQLQIKNLKSSIIDSSNLILLSLSLKGEAGKDEPCGVIGFTFGEKLGDKKNIFMADPKTYEFMDINKQ